MNIAPNNSIAEKKKKILTTKYSEVNVRNGPGLNHLKIYKILKKGYPLEIVDKFENWRKVIDINGVTGWVAKSQLSNENYVIVRVREDFIFKFPKETSKKVAKVRKNFVIKNQKCNENWCFVVEKNIKGWVNKNSIWGDINEN